VSNGPANCKSVEIAAHYGLPVEDDVVLVHTLLALEASVLTEYHRKRPLSQRAIAELERMLGDPPLPSGALSHFVNFVQNTKLESPAIYDTLRRIATSAGQTEINRNFAASILVQTKCPIEFLVSARREVQDPRIQTLFLDALTERQHLPTIYERLNRLPASDAELAALERPFPETTELQWIGKIRVPETWNMLAELRKRLLRLALPNLAAVVESTLASIDKARLIGLIGDQLPDTPESWREYAKTRMGEYERERRFEQAASITFDEVLARMAEVNSEYRIRLLCEGLTDEAVFKVLLDATGLGMVSTHSVGGWGNVCSPLFDVGPYIDGFQYALLVLDGDNGRDLRAPGRPIRPEIQPKIDKVEATGVPVRVLKRYGIENYFSQSALERVLDKHLSGSFPLDEIRPVSDQIGGYNKNLNVEVIKHMQATDFDGTDIAVIMEEIRKRVPENAK
jgi:hypothetical protein